VLNKGITFVPVSNRINYTAIDADFKRFERKLQLEFFFTNKRSIVHHDNLNTPEEPKLNMVPFTKNPNFWPKKLNPHITKFCNNVKDKVLKLLHNKKAHNNLTPGELRGLRDLRNDNKIVIKKGDKGTGIVIMNTVDYERKIMEQLDDVNTYIRKEYNDIIEIKKQANKFIFDLHDKGFINKKK